MRRKRKRNKLLSLRGLIIGMTVYVTLQDVEQYLRDCELAILEGHLGVLGESVGYKTSASHVCEGCERVDRKSPVIALLRQDGSEETWAQLMVTSKKIATERGLNPSEYFIHV